VEILIRVGLHAVVLGNWRKVWRLVDASGWLYMRRVVVVGQRRARGGKAGWDFYDDRSFSVVLS
jgi:hypothetical protein